MGSGSRRPRIVAAIVATAIAMDATRRLLLAAPFVPLLAGCSMVENFFFYPDAATYAQPAQFGLKHEDVFFRVPDGSRLHGWWLPALRQPALGSVLHLHGNAANITNHLPLAAWLPQAGYDVLMFDYRGFGRSEGRPSLHGVVDDAAAALAELRKRAHTADRLVLFGQSLGGATALRLLARDAQGVRAAIIDSAFSSYRQIARDAAAAPARAGRRSRDRAGADQRPAAVRAWHGRPRGAVVAHRGPGGGHARPACVCPRGRRTAHGAVVPTCRAARRAGAAGALALTARRRLGGLPSRSERSDHTCLKRSGLRMRR
jgi:pimeloyl-ACP methyl ester carboxylesterase